MKNNTVSPLLTDMYQITMAYAYWKNGDHENRAVFDLIFRNCPFNGEFAIFGGLSEVMDFVENFKFSQSDLNYIRSLMPTCDIGFLDWLGKIDCSEVKIYAVQEGSVVFPRVPLIRVEGPLGIAQILETALLNLVNYATLMATNAARLRLAAGFDKTLLEFGLRRAQGPNGALSASRYSYLGGFDASSNVLAGYLYGIPVKGTHAHAYVQSFTGLEDLKSRDLGDTKDFVDLVLQHRLKIEKDFGLSKTNDGELAAFIAYAQAFPEGFLALVDTYDTLKSGVPNYLAVALALHQVGYQAQGIRLDSGDLAYLSKEARKMFRMVIDEDIRFAGFNWKIVASNDINEKILLSLAEQGHEIDVFGVGTHLVTCQAQPALGGVYKLVECNNQPRIKLSQDIVKVTLPGRKSAYRLIGKDGMPILDLLMPADNVAPKVGEKIYCRHPFDPQKRAWVTPAAVQSLHHLMWDGSQVAEEARLPLSELQVYAMQSLNSLRSDHTRLVNPTPFKVSVDEEIFNSLHRLWSEEAPVAELS